MNLQSQISSIAKAMFLATLVFFALTAGSMAESMSIPSESVDDQRIFWGNANNFKNPGSVDYIAIVSATDAYEEAKQVESGTARYWILVNRANETAVRAISAVGREAEYDLIVAAGYLERLDPPIETEDITELALAKLK